MVNNNTFHFDKYLWNRYDKLHDRIIKKISYLSSLLNYFNNIYNIKTRYYKSLQPLLKDEKDDMFKCKEEVYFKNIFNILKNTNENFNKYEEKMYLEIINNIKDSIEKWKKENNYYKDYLVSLSIYKEEKKKLERYQKIYQENSLMAEKATLYLKELVIKKKINNDPLINQFIELCEQDSKNRLTIMSKDISNYINTLEKINTLRIKLNLKQVKLLQKYEEYEKDDKYLYPKILEILMKHQQTKINITNENLNIPEEIEKDIKRNINENIQELIESLRSKEEPEMKISFSHYPKEIDLEICNNLEDYIIRNEVIKTMKKYSNKIFIDYDLRLDEKINKMSEKNNEKNNEKNKEKNNSIQIKYFQDGTIRRKIEYSYGNYCKGILYENNKEIYKGLLKKGLPHRAKNLTIYDKNKYKVYKGDFDSFKYNGKGILYYRNSNIIYFEGYFIDNNYDNGVMFDPEGNILYEGKFIDNHPKESKNIKYYERNGNIKYIGDFKEGKYHGFGKLYNNNNHNNIVIDGFFENNKIKGKLFKNNILYYEGEFLNEEIQGNGIFFYENGKKYIEGNFQKEYIFGKGIKYYENGSKKMDGIFKSINICIGKYYNPNNKVIYEGEIINEIPIKYDKIKIYNDNMYKIYGRDIIDGIKKAKYLEYFPNFYYINKDIDTLESKNEKSILSKVIFLSWHTKEAGKKNLIRRLMSKDFVEKSYKSNGIHFEIYNYKYNNTLYEIKLYDTKEGDKYQLNEIINFKTINIVIFIFNLCTLEEIDDESIDFVKKQLSENSMIYFVGNKIDICEQEIIEKHRNKIKILINKNKINKYFELSAKTMEGVNNFIKNLEIDNVIITNNYELFYDKNISNNLISLNKYINY